MTVNTRLTTADWINRSHCLGLNTEQKFGFLAINSIADTNGCFENDPETLCMLLHLTPADLEILFRVMISKGLLVAYEVQGNQYWYLTEFLEQQRLRAKAKVPCPPWLAWRPESPNNLSRGCYYDLRKELPAPSPLDNKLPREEIVKGIDIEKEEITIYPLDKNVTVNHGEPLDKKPQTETDFAHASNDERMKLALKQLLDGKYGIRATLQGDEEQQRQTIQRMLQVCSRSLEVADIVDQYTVVCDEGNWDVIFKQWLLTNRNK